MCGFPNEDWLSMLTSVYPPSQVADNREETVKLRELTKRLYAQLKEMEKRHQEERERLQVWLSRRATWDHFLQIWVIDLCCCCSSLPLIISIMSGSHLYISSFHPPLSQSVLGTRLICHIRHRLEDFRLYHGLICCWLLKQTTESMRMSYW